MRARPQTDTVIVTIMNTTVSGARGGVRSINRDIGFRVQEGIEGSGVLSLGYRGSSC